MKKIQGLQALHGATLVVERQEGEALNSKQSKVVLYQLVVVQS